MGLGLFQKGKKSIILPSKIRLNNIIGGMMYLIRQMTSCCTQNNKLWRLTATPAQEEKIEIERKWYVLSALVYVVLRSRITKLLLAMNFECQSVKKQPIISSNFPPPTLHIVQCTICHQSNDKSNSTWVYSWHVQVVYRVSKYYLQHVIFNY